ncbi:MAG: methyltransferase domain-containing protein [Thermoanaerobaculia bacterium]
MDSKPSGAKPADAATLARDLVDRLEAISASLSHGPDRPADGREEPSAAGASAPLADFRSPRAVLENGAGYVAPYLPAEASLRPLKALLLRVLRVVTRDQTVFNSAILESLRGTLLAADGAFRETAAAIDRARAEAMEAARREAGTAIVRTEAAEQAQREAEKRIFGALERSRLALEDALRAAGEETRKSLEEEGRRREEITSRLGRVDEAQKTEARLSGELRAELRNAVERLRRLETGTAASLAHFKNRADEIASDVRDTQARVDGLERSRDLLAADVSATQVRVDGLEKDRDLLLSDSSSARTRFETLEKDRDRLAGAQGESARASEAIGAELLKTQVRVDGLEKDRDLLLSESSSAKVRLESLEGERGRLSEESAANRRAAEGISGDLLKTQVRVDDLERDRDRLSEASASGAKAASEIAADLFRSQVRVDGLEKDRDRLLDTSAVGSRTAEELKASLAALEARNAERVEDLRHLKLEWSTLRSEIGALSGRGAKKGTAAAGAPAVPSAGDPFRAGIYVDFEEGFRGSEKEIRKRQEADAALFKKVHGPVADLGCGRGEFLEALKAAGIPAVGCDANPVMAARAKKKGLKVEKADLFEWLGAQRKGSLGGITAYQVVEHLPPARIYELVELSAAKLAPGGILLFETVNPESAYAMKWFWMDLTHVRPVPAPSLSRLLSACGFRDVRIDWRSPVPASEAPPAGLRDDEKLGPMIRLLFGPQDYAVIGRK